MHHARTSQMMYIVNSTPRLWSSLNQQIMRLLFSSTIPSAKNMDTCDLDITAQSLNFRLNLRFRFDFLELSLLEDFACGKFGLEFVDSFELGNCQTSAPLHLGDKIQLTFFIKFLIFLATASSPASSFSSALTAS